ncbi:MAG: alanine dehydrogenase [Anaerolineales bacterium]|nr:alanine dehydrogenase [Anaerolineales bacterium]
MNIGIPKEIRPSEYRVGLSPAGVKTLTRRGHTCYVENEAGLGAGFADLDYQQAGATIVYSPMEVYARADLVLKFARPMDEELEWIQPGKTIAGWLQLPSARQSKIDILLERKITSIAYEQIEDMDGKLTVMHPLSEIGGRMAGQIAANLLQNNMGGNGVLLSGMPGVPPAEVIIIGCGVVGTYAAETLQNMGAHITCLDVNLTALQRIHDNNPGIVTMYSTAENITRACAYADVVITAAMHPGQTAPILVTREILRSMKTRSIIMDLSIDLGGCVETSRPTTHDNPTFVEEGVTHYCVPNIPSVVARTATHASFNASFPYILEIVTHGVEKAIENNSALAKAVNTHGGKIYNLSRLASKTG